MKRSITVRPKGVGRTCRSVLLFVPRNVERTRSASFPTSGFTRLSSPVSLTKTKITKQTHFVITNYSITTTLYPPRVRNPHKKRTHFAGPPVQPYFFHLYWFS